MSEFGFVTPNFKKGDKVLVARRFASLDWGEEQDEIESEMLEKVKNRPATVLYAYYDDGDIIGKYESDSLKELLDKLEQLIFANGIELIKVKFDDNEEIKSFEPYELMLLNNK